MANFTASEFFAVCLKPVGRGTVKMTIAGREQQRVVQWYLRDWRLRRGLKQHHIANRMKTSVSMISEQESGTKRLNDDWIDKWSEAIGVRPIDLLMPPPEDEPPPPSVEDARLQKAMELFQAAEDQDFVLKVLAGLVRPPPESA